MLIVMDYQDFLKIPEIKRAFNKMLTEKQNYFRDKNYLDNGFDKQHLELACLKMSFITTDMYFSELHRNKVLNKSKIIE